MFPMRRTERNPHISIQKSRQRRDILSSSILKIKKLPIKQTKSSLKKRPTFNETPLITAPLSIVPKKLPHTKQLSLIPENEDSIQSSEEINLVQTKPKLHFSPDVVNIANILPKVTKYMIQYKKTQKIDDETMNNKFPEILDMFFLDMFFEIHPEYKKTKDNLQHFKNAILNSVNKQTKVGGKSTRKQRRR